MPQAKLTIEEIRQKCKGKITKREADGAEMAAVKVICPMCFCHGHKHPRGDVFAMEISLVPAHVAGGQVEIVTGKK